MGGDIWLAEAADALQPGDQVEVVGVVGLKLTVRCEDMHRQSEHHAAASERDTAMGSVSTALEVRTV
jgi:membrane-bound ClpP family serine protease